MVWTDTRAGCSDIKINVDTMNMYQFKHDVSKANLQVAEWMNKISIAVETYPKIARRGFNLLYSYYCPICRDYTDTRISKCEEYKYFFTK